MRKIIICFFIAAIASLIAFVIHVATIEWISKFVSTIMSDLEVKPSWDVRYIAAFTFIEIGVSLVIIYIFMRQSIPVKSPVLKGFILGILLLMIQGSLIRQPVMDFIIGNPLNVVLIQDGIIWGIWLTISIFVAVSYEYLIVNNSSEII